MELASARLRGARELRTEVRARGVDEPDLPTLVSPVATRVRSSRTAPTRPAARPATPGEGGPRGQQGVTVLAATNRPRDLDPAILRGGRLARIIAIPLPDADQRRAILTVLTDKTPLTHVDLQQLAEQSDG